MEEFVKIDGDVFSFLVGGFSYVFNLVGGVGVYILLMRVLFD